MNEGDEGFDRAVADEHERFRRPLPQDAVLEQHDQLGDDAGVAEMAERGGRRFLDEGFFADDAPRRRRAVLADALPAQGIQHRRQGARIPDHAQRHDGVPLYGPVFHRFDQRVDGAGVADHAQRNGRILAHGAIGIFQRVNERIHHRGVFDPGSAVLVVGGHAAQCPGRVAAHDEIRIFQGGDERLDSGLADVDQGRAGRFAHDLRGVLEKLDQVRDRLRIGDLAEGFGRGRLHGAVAVATGHDEPIDRLGGFDLAASLGGMFAHAPAFIFQRRDQTIDRGLAHVRGRGHRPVPYFRDGIVEEGDEGLDGLGAADLGRSPAGVEAHRPVVVAAGPHERLQRRGIGQLGQFLGGVLARRVVDVFEFV